MRLWRSSLRAFLLYESDLESASGSLRFHLCRQRDLPWMNSVGQVVVIKAEDELMRTGTRGSVPHDHTREHESSGHQC